MVDKTMMGDKCAELVRAAMIGALAVTLGNPTAVYAAEEETADPGQIGIEIAGEAAVGAASFCVGGRCGGGGTCGSGRGDRIGRYAE